MSRTRRGRRDHAPFGRPSGHGCGPRVPGSRAGRPTRCGRDPVRVRDRPRRFRVRYSRVVPRRVGERERLRALVMAVIDQPFTERLRLMTSGQTDLHCGGANTNLPLPAYLRRERFLDLTAGIVAREGQPPLECKPVVRELSDYLWIDYDSPASAAQAATPPDAGSSSLGRLLERLYRQTARRVTAILRAGNPGMFLTAAPGIARPPGRAAAEAPRHPVRPPALPDQLRRPPLSRAPGIVSFPRANRARHRARAQPAAARIGYTGPGACTVWSVTADPAGPPLTIRLSPASLVQHSGRGDSTGA